MAIKSIHSTPSENDPDLFPELRFTTLKSYADEWAKDWPVIQVIRLVRSKPACPKVLRGVPYKYALIFSITGDNESLSCFEAETKYYHTIKDEERNGLLYEKFMPASFAHVYVSPPLDKYQEEWCLIPQRLINLPREGFQYEDKPAWRLFDRSATSQATTISHTVKEAGRKGGMSNKKNIVLQEAIEAVLIKEPRLKTQSATLIWKHFKRTYHIDCPLKVQDGSVYFNEGIEDNEGSLITQSDLGNGQEKSISLRTFKRYVSEIKE